MKNLWNRNACFIFRCTLMFLLLPISQSQFSSHLENFPLSFCFCFNATTKQKPGETETEIMRFWNARRNNIQVFANIIEFWGAPDRLLFRAKNVNNLIISIFFYHPSTLFSAPTRTKNTLFGFHREDECSSWKYAFNKRKQKRANRYKSKRLNIYNTNMSATNGVHIFVIVLFIYTRRKKNRRDAKDAAVV